MWWPPPPVSHGPEYLSTLKASGECMLTMARILDRILITVIKISQRLHYYLIEVKVKNRVSEISLVSKGHGLKIARVLERIPIIVQLVVDDLGMHISFYKFISFATI
jgi:hypothetical protein